MGQATRPLLEQDGVFGRCQLVHLGMLYQPTVPDSGALDVATALFYGAEQLEMVTRYSIMQDTRRETRIGGLEC